MTGGGVRFSTRLQPTALREPRGAVSLLFVIIAATVVMCVLALVSLGQRLELTARSVDVASEAARYGASWVDEESIAYGVPKIDPVAAVTEAVGYAKGAGAADATASVNPLRTSVTVHVTLRRSDPLTGQMIEAGATHTATVLWQP